MLVVEAIGYEGRAFPANGNPGPYTLTPYPMQNVLLLLAPAFLAASVYMMLSHIVFAVDGARSLIIPRRWLTKVFVASDVLSLLMQSAGKYAADPGSLYRCRD